MIVSNTHIRKLTTNGLQNGGESVEQLPEKIEQLLLPYFFEEDEKKKIAQTVYKIAVLLNGLSYTQIIIILKTFKSMLPANIGRRR